MSADRPSQPTRHDEPRTPTADAHHRQADRSAAARHDSDGTQRRQPYETRSREEYAAAMHARPPSRGSNDTQKPAEKQDKAGPPGAPDSQRRARPLRELAHRPGPATAPDQASRQPADTRTAPQHTSARLDQHRSPPEASHPKIQAQDQGVIQKDGIQSSGHARPADSAQQPGQPGGGRPRADRTSGHHTPAEHGKNHKPDNPAQTRDTSRQPAHPGHDRAQQRPEPAGTGRPAQTEARHGHDSGSTPGQRGDPPAGVRPLHETRTREEYADAMHARPPARTDRTSTSAEATSPAKDHGLAAVQPDRARHDASRATAHGRGDTPGAPHPAGNSPNSRDTWQATGKAIRADDIKADGHRDAGTNVVGRKPDRSPGDTSDLPPSGEGLIRPDDTGKSRAERLRRKAELNLGDAKDGVNNTVTSIQELLERPPPTGHREVSVPGGPGYRPESMHYGVPDAGTAAEVGLVAAILGAHFYHWASKKIGELRGRHAGH